MQRNERAKSAEAAVPTASVEAAVSAAGASSRKATRLPLQPCKIDISIRDQMLTLTRDDEIVRTFSISSSRFGLGTEEDSNKTPLGRFQIGTKIGHGMPHGTIFQSRVPLGSQDPLPPTEDLVTSRILWLDGLDEENANTRDRFIYIHGTKHEDKIGRPDSHGCIRMRNADVIELFELVDEETPVTIRA